MNVRTKKRVKIEIHPLQKEHQSQLEAAADNDNILTSTDPDELSDAEVIKAGRLLHAKALAKAAILKYKANNDVSSDVKTTLSAVASFRRAPKSTRRPGAVADLAKLKLFISTLDNAIACIKK